MPVQFKTADLLDSARKIVNRKAQAKVEFEKTHARNAVRHREEWLKQNTPNIKALRDYLTKCLRNGTTPTEKGAGEALGRCHGGMDTYGRLKDEAWQYGGYNSANTTRPPGYGADQANELPGLISLLEAHQDETISPHQLANMGIKGRLVAQLFRDLAVAQKQEVKK